MAALRQRLPQLAVEGAAAGLHVLLRLADDSDVDIAAAAAERGIGVRAMSGLSLVDPPARGLVLGYGRLPLERIDAAVAELAAVIAAGPSAGRAPAEALRAGH